MEEEHKLSRKDAGKRGKIGRVSTWHFQCKDDQQAEEWVLIQLRALTHSIISMITGPGCQTQSRIGIETLLNTPDFILALDGRPSSATTAEYISAQARETQAHGILCEKRDNTK